MPDLRGVVRGVGPLSRSAFTTVANTDRPSGFETISTATNMPSDPSGFNIWLNVNRRYEDGTGAASSWSNRDFRNLKTGAWYEQTFDGQLLTWSAFFRVHTNRFFPVSESMAPVAGDLFYYDGAFWNRIPKGANGQFLKMVSGLPAWSN